MRPRIGRDRTQCLMLTIESVKLITDFRKVRYNIIFLLLLFYVLLLVILKNSLLTAPVKI